MTIHLNWTAFFKTVLNVAAISIIVYVIYGKIETETITLWVAMQALMNSYARK